MKKTKKQYIINEENDTGAEHAKLVLSILAQSPDKTLNEVINATVPKEFRANLYDSFCDLVKDIESDYLI